MSRYDWREYLGRKEYQRGWVDFFEDELVEGGFEWWGVVGGWVFGDQVLGGGLMGGCEF